MNDNTTRVLDAVKVGYWTEDGDGAVTMSMSSAANCHLTALVEHHAAPGDEPDDTGVNFDAGLHLTDPDDARAVAAKLDAYADHVEAALEGGDGE